MVAVHRSRQIASMAVASLPLTRGMMHSSRHAAIDFIPGRNRNRYPMPVMPLDVSTSQIRMSRMGPSAWPLSQGSSGQGMRSIVTRMSRMVMSGLVMGAVSLGLSLVGLIMFADLAPRKSTTESRRSSSAARHVRNAQAMTPRFVMPGLDPGIHHFSRKMDRRVKPGDDDLASGPLLRAHQIGEAVEQIVRVARAGRGLGVILHREHRLAVELDAAIGAVEQRDVRLRRAFRQSRLVHGKAVVHRGDLDLAGGLVLHRVIGAVMALVHLFGLGADGQS